MRLDNTPVVCMWTAAADGDQRRLGAGLAAPRAAPGDRRLYRLRQVHGAEVVAVSAPGTDPPVGLRRWDAVGGVPPDADAVVADGADSVLAVLTADCAAVALGSPEGVHGAVHAGWRGVAAGVLERAVDAMQVLGASGVAAGLGPCIGPCCYEFSPSDVDVVAASYGDVVRAATTAGACALDLPAAVRCALARRGVELVVDAATCTACHPGFFSHRARADENRQALLVWAAPGGAVP